MKFRRQKQQGEQGLTKADMLISLVDVLQMLDIDDDTRKNIYEHLYEDELLEDVDDLDKISEEDSVLKKILKEKEE